MWTLRYFLFVLRAYAGPQLWHQPLHSVLPSSISALLPKEYAAAPLFVLTLLIGLVSVVLTSTQKLRVCFFDLSPPPSSPFCSQTTIAVFFAPLAPPLDMQFVKIRTRRSCHWSFAPPPCLSGVSTRLTKMPCWSALCCSFCRTALSLQKSPLRCTPSNRVPTCLSSPHQLAATCTCSPTSHFVT